MNLQNFYNKRVLSALLSFTCIIVLSQRIIVENRNDFSLQIKYNEHIIKVNKGENKIISDKEIQNLYIEYDNGKKISRYVPLFLNSDEFLKIIIYNYDKPFEFKGDKDALHTLIVNQQHYILYKNVVKYQDIYYKKKNTKELINFSEIVLIDYLNKIKTINTSEDERYKRIEKYVINDWIPSLFFFLTGSKTLDNQSKELIIYYYNKYIKKDINTYTCDYQDQYYIISELAEYINQLNIFLPKYEIKVNSEDDNINQYLPQSCQHFYFLKRYNYLNHINSPEREYYKKVLKEKFNN